VQAAGRPLPGAVRYGHGAFDRYDATVQGIEVQGIYVRHEGTAKAVPRLRLGPLP